MKSYILTKASTALAGVAHLVGVSVHQKGDA